MKHYIEDKSENEKLQICYVIIAIILSTCLLYFWIPNNDKQLAHYSILGPTTKIVSDLAHDLKIFQNFLNIMEEMRVSIAEVKLDVIKLLLEEGILDKAADQILGEQKPDGQKSTCRIRSFWNYRKKI